MRAEQDDSMEKIRQMCELNHASYEVDYSDCQVGLFILFVIFMVYQKLFWPGDSRFEENQTMVTTSLTQISLLV